MRLRDGRRLAYRAYGDESGFPVLWFHGTPGGRTEFANRFGPPAIDGTGARVIAIDRPGFGRSDFQPDRTFDSWPADVTELADHLALERFAVVGYSAGGPYVLACAAAIAPRLSFAAIVSGVGPAETPAFAAGLARPDRSMMRLSHVAPPLARSALRVAVQTARRRPELFSRRVDKELSPPDRAIHADPAYRAATRELFLEATRAGPHGMVEEYRIWSERWGCRFEQIRMPVHLWHGDTDPIVPIHHARYLANRLPAAELTVLPDTGHLHTPRGWHDIFTATVTGSGGGCAADR